MKCMLIREKNGRSGIKVMEYDELDSRPEVDFIFADASPKTENPNHIAVSATLAFGKYADAKFQLPSPADPDTTAAITNYLSSPQVVVYPVSVDPQVKTSGSMALEITHGPAGSRTVTPNAFAHTLNLNILPSDKYSGRLVTMSGMDVGSNAVGLKGSEYDRIRSLHCSLALALLFASDLQVGLLEVPSWLGTEGELSQIRPLFDAIGVTLKSKKTDV